MANVPLTGFTKDSGVSLMRLPDEDFGQWTKRTDIASFSSLAVSAYLYIALGYLNGAREMFEAIVKSGGAFAAKQAEVALAELKEIEKGG
jgi:hypothetical protein